MCHKIMYLGREGEFWTHMLVKQEKSPSRHLFSGTLASPPEVFKLRRRKTLEIPFRSVGEAETPPSGISAKPGSGTIVALHGFIRLLSFC
jgi:hypothetical protein